MLVKAIPGSNLMHWDHVCDSFVPAVTFAGYSSDSHAMGHVVHDESAVPSQYYIYHCESHKKTRGMDKSSHVGREHPLGVKDSLRQLDIGEGGLSYDTYLGPDWEPHERYSHKESAIPMGFAAAGTRERVRVGHTAVGSLLWTVSIAEYCQQDQTPGLSD